MLKIILPIVFIIVLVLGGLGYWRYTSSKTNLTTPTTEEQAQQEPIEVPATLPEATIEDRVKVLEDLIAKLVTQVNALKSQSSAAQTAPLASTQASITELKARVAILEKATPAPSTSTSVTAYIPLGSSGVYTNTDWVSLPEYEISLDPANFPGYSGMVLESTFRMDDPSGTASVRLYNVTDGSATSTQLDSTTSTATTFTLRSSASFKLATGAKTYRLQVKSSAGKNLFLQSARIRVTF